MNKTRELHMGTIHQLYSEDGIPLRDRFLELLSPVLKEPAMISAGKRSPQATHDALLLLEQNARLRSLAIQLSDLVKERTLSK
jgi:hypothetical protein